ncbi:MAG: hypothetical protein QOE70_6636 [Chthoniobacter sp.]|jgi:hypothetical protein|nr:hypothetical protein [Chthoniobacter sp.]
MKYFLLIGGFCGFLTVFASGIAAGNDLSSVLSNATIGCLGGAFLMRGFRLLLMHQIRQLTAAPAEPGLAAEAPVATRE